MRRTGIHLGPIKTPKIKQIEKNAIKLRNLIKENGLRKTASFLGSWIREDKTTHILKIQGRRIFVRPRTPDLNVAIESLGKEYAKIKGIIPNELAGCIIDAGGYIGTSALALSEIFPRCQIITIEPHGGNFRVLVDNVASNKMITPVNAALVPTEWRERGEVQLADRKAGEWGMQIQPTNGAKKYDKKLETITIDEAINMTGCKRALIVKMDIEGSERDILKSSSQWLDKTDCFFVELHPDIHEDIEAIYTKACSNRREVQALGEKKLSVVNSFPLATQKDGR